LLADTGLCCSFLCFSAPLATHAIEVNKVVPTLLPHWANRRTTLDLPSLLRYTLGLDFRAQFRPFLLTPCVQTGRVTSHHLAPPSTSVWPTRPADPLPPLVPPLSAP